VGEWGGGPSHHGICIIHVPGADTKMTGSPIPALRNRSRSARTMPNNVQLKKDPPQIPGPETEAANVAKPLRGGLIQLFVSAPFRNGHTAADVSTPGLG